MSKQLIQQYRSNVEKLIRFGGSRNESVLRKAFQELLDHYARRKNLLLVPEVEFPTTHGNKVYPDGTLKDALRQNWGFWESKDEKDNLSNEIEAKFEKGYPDFNILFEDTHTAILYQNGIIVHSASFSDDDSLDALLTKFVSYEPSEVKEFHKAINQFSSDVPSLAKTLREIIDEQYTANQLFASSLNEFLNLCQKAINPKVNLADIREMIIQHILTEDIFMRVFDETEFHRENIVAQKLQNVAATFYKGITKRNIDSRIAPYYETINARASQISDHHEKQKFLKALYENFYRAYNPKAADRLGVMYTPEEIVRFMIESTDYLLFKQFNKTLGEDKVEILDPATGTGTFITEIIEYLPPNQLEKKYESEIHCNEVAILPYYIANLNIEFTYKQKTGKFKDFENICFVDTLDNLGFTGSSEKQLNFFGLWDANIERIGEQNNRKISVIIGNPPYNANQLNENENNKNSVYPEIDRRIKDTYIRYSTAQKTKNYDMYCRFLRWASDRIDQDGIIAFVSNNSFLEGRNYDGFRKIVSDEFNEIHIIDLKGDAQTSGDRRKREGGNIFSNKIKVGIAIYFLIKKRGVKGCRIFYNCVPDFATEQEKKSYVRDNKFEELHFEPIHPDEQNNWLNQPTNSWDNLIPIASKSAKFNKNRNDQKAVFKNFSLGIVTARDEWVYDFSVDNLEKKVQYLIKVYNNDVDRLSNIEISNIVNNLDYSIKWTRAVKNDLVHRKKYKYSRNNVVDGLYRPYVIQKVYFSKDLNEMQNLMGRFFHHPNFCICISGPNSPKPFTTLATNKIPDYNSLSPAADGCRVLPFYDYSESGEQIENITDWALNQFHQKYGDKKINIKRVFSIMFMPYYTISLIF